MIRATDSEHLEISDEQAEDDQKQSASVET
jgi:hypothetical protein